MTITEKPNDIYYIPIGNNFVIRLNEVGLKYCDVLINDVHRFVFYPFNDNIYMNLKDVFKSLFLSSFELVKGYRVKVQIRTFGTGVNPIATEILNYTLLPYGVNYYEPIEKLQQPIAQDFLASPVRVVSWLGLPFSAIKYNSNGDPINTTDGLIIEQREQLCGNYLRFFNALGGYSYWLFNEGTRTKQTQDLGEIYNDYNSFYNTYAPTIYRGKDSNELITCASGNLQEWEQDIVRPIFVSPLVEFWNGYKWLSVKITGSNYLIQTTKHKNLEYTISFVFPDDNNINI